MSKHIEVSNIHLMPILIEVIESGQKVKLIVTGSSMSPFIRSNIDCVELVKRQYKQIRKLDIVLIQRESGEYILHRIAIKTGNEFYIVGDSQIELEGPLKPSQIIAVTTGIWRGNKYIDATNYIYRLLVYFWMLFRRNRHIIRGTWKILKRFLRRYK